MAHPTAHTLSMSSRIGHRARAVKHVMDTYKSVILRPRFKATEVDTKWIDSDYPQSVFTFKIDDSAYVLTCRSMSSTISIFCFCQDDDPNGYGGHRFHFKDHFAYNDFGKLKQKALILLKKIAAKPVYDTMLV